MDLTSICIADTWNPIRFQWILIRFLCNYLESSQISMDVNSISIDFTGFELDVHVLLHLVLLE